MHSYSTSCDAFRSGCGHLRIDFPGKGIRALNEGGYTGPYCLELLSDKSLPDSLWNWPPEKLVKENMKAFKELWYEAMPAASIA